MFLPAPGFKIGGTAGPPTSCGVGTVIWQQEAAAVHLPGHTPGLVPCFLPAPGFKIQGTAGPNAHEGAWCALDTWQQEVAADHLPGHTPGSSPHGLPTLRYNKSWVLLTLDSM